MHLPRAVDDGNGPEQNVGRRLAECVSEVIEVDIVVLRVHGVPRKLHAADGHFVAVVGNNGELVGKVLFLTDAWTAPSVSPVTPIGSRSSQRWIKPSRPGAVCGEAGFVRVI